MASAIPGFTPTLPPASSATPSTGLNGMDSGAFLKLMLAQLQQQDPLSPTDSNQLLTQLSQISNLQSNTAMAQNIQGLTLQQSIGAAGNLIGKPVKGIDPTGQPVDGIVTSVKVQNKQVLLELDSGHQLPLGNVTDIANNTTGAAAPAPAAPDPAALAAALSQLPVQAPLSNNSGNGTVVNPGGQSITNVIKALSSLGAK